MSGIIVSDNAIYSREHCQPPTHRPRGGQAPRVPSPRLRPWPSLTFDSPLLRCSPPFAPPARACCVAAPGCSSPRAPCLFGASPPLPPRLAVLSRGSLGAPAAAARAPAFRPARVPWPPSPAVSHAPPFGSVCPSRFASVSA